MMQKLVMFFTGIAVVICLSIASLAGQSVVAQETLLATSPTPPGRSEVCAIVMTMPGAKDTNELLTLLKTDRPKILSDLRAMKVNMQQYDAEGYGWQNAIDGPSALPPRPASWLIGALRMACES